MREKGILVEGDRLSSRMDRETGGLAVAVGGTAIYALAHAVLRLMVSDNLGEDDGRTAVLLQEMRLVWWAKQPPLYDWLLAGVQTFLGPTLASFLAVKYVLLVAIAALVFLIARRLLGDPWWALLTVEALGLIYQLSWRFHEGFTNAVGAMVCSLALLAALIRTYDSGRPGDFVVLGLTAGAAMLTSLAGVLVVAALAIAGWLTGEVRARIFRPELRLAVLAAVLVVLPYAGWLVSDTRHVAELVMPTPDEVAISFAGRAWQAVLDAIRGPLFALSPLAPVLVVVFAGLRARLVALARGQSAGEAAPALERMIGIYSLVVWAGLVFVLPLTGQPGGIATHTQLPFFLPTVVWMMAKAKRASNGVGEERLFSRLAIGLAGFAFLLRAANLIVLDPVCGTCRWAVPYEDLAAAIRAEGFTQGTILTLDNDTAGNLRRYFPQARVRSNAAGWFVPHETAASTGQPTLYVWSTRFPDDFARRIGEAYLGPRLGPLIAGAHTVEARWRYLYPRQRQSTSAWKLLLVR